MNVESKQANSWTKKKRKQKKNRLSAFPFGCVVYVCLYVNVCALTISWALWLIFYSFSCQHFAFIFHVFFVCVLCSSTKFIIAVLLLSFLITSIIHFWDGPMRMSRCKRQKKRRTLSRFTFLNVFSSLMTEDIAKSYESTTKSIFPNHDGFLHRHLKISVL